nr:MAG TPA: Septum formation initiator [Caudoviricetes sp.]DAU58327.1 MAG TPA: Septum formation initiator [Caudoviricetes sp.]
MAVVAAVGLLTAGGVALEEALSKDTRVTEKLEEKMNELKKKSSDLDNEWKK